MKLPISLDYGYPEDEWHEIATINKRDLKVGLRVRARTNADLIIGFEYKVWNHASNRWACRTSILIKHSSSGEEPEEFPRSEVIDAVMALFYGYLSANNEVELN